MKLSFLLRGGMAGLFVLGGIPAFKAEAWSPVYAPGSTPDQILRFEQSSGSAETPPYYDVSSFPDGITTDSVTAGTATVGSWLLQARGRAVRTSDGVRMATIFSLAAVNANALEFYFSVDGWSSLDGLSMTSSWSGSADVTDSDSWTASGSHFRYSFDVNLDGGLLGFSPTFYSEFSLTIMSGSEVLYSGGLSDIFTTLQGGINSGFVEFDYTKASPLQITWGGSALLNYDLLDYYWPNDVLAFSVSNGLVEVDAVPEPGTYALLAGSLMMFGLYRKTRKRSV